MPGIRIRLVRAVPAGYAVLPCGRMPRAARLLAPPCQGQGGADGPGALALWL